MSIIFFVLTILFLWLSPLYGFQLDDLVQEDPSDLQQSSIKERSFALCNYSREIICYDKKQKFMGYPIKEAVIRFTRNGTFESADITIDYAVKQQDFKRIQSIEQDLSKRFEQLFCTKSMDSSFSFPNKHTIHVRFYGGRTVNIRTFCHLANYKKSGNISFISVRIQSCRYTDKDLKDIIRVRPLKKMQMIPYKGGRLLPVPMRRQHDGTGGCWFTTMARQLGCLGSEIMPLMLLVGLNGGNGANDMNRLGRLYGFRYITKGITPKPQAAKNCIEFIEKYNEAAVQHGIAPIKISKGKDNAFSWHEHINIIDLDLARSLKLKSFSGNGYKQFRQMVFESIDKGYPIGWTVTRHSRRGKHRRMIFGYNRSQDMIYYTDTWGRRDNFNQMHFMTAYLVTVWVQIIRYP